MSLKVLKKRITALLLFFIDYRVLIYCFTIVLLMISGSRLLEDLFFENLQLSFKLVLSKLYPVLLFELLVYVSYRLFCHVHLFTTILKTLLISTILCLPFLLLKIDSLRENIQNVSSFTGQTISISGVVLSAEKEKTFQEKIQLVILVLFCR